MSDVSRFSSGARLGPYEVLSKLGEGGMGEVYRARDTKLDRDVALKILPESFASDPDRLMRFEREAKTLATLNHPNIGAIYGIEEQGTTRALVMELVEGEDLAAVIARGALPVVDALPIARQIADALEAAHEQGIVHRDLKPQNIKVRADGTVKVLDFGLAKALDSGTSGPRDSGNPGPWTLDPGPTMTSPALTQMGVILGTAAYMAPEQARGRSVDKRADIWAFGVVLYEMLTGRQLFNGETMSDTISAVLRADVDMGALPTDTPAPIRRLLTRCLDRDPKTRLRDIGEARVALAAPLEPAVAASPRPPVAWWQRPIVIAGAIVLALVAGLVVSTVFRSGPSTQAPPVTRFELPIDPGFKVWSPDGTQLAWLTRPGGQQQIFVRRRDDFENRLLDVGAGLRRSLAFSPDGEWLAYTHAPPGHTTAATEVRKVRVTGGPSELVGRVTVTSVNIAALAWEAGHLWLASGQVLQAIPESGGAARTAVTLPENRNFMSGRLQQINGGRDLLFVVSDRTATGERGVFGLWTAPVAGGQPREVMNQVICFAVTPAGDLVYTKVDGLLWARRFKAETIEVIGEPVSLMELSYAGADAFTLSLTGALAFGRDVPARREPVWMQRSGGRVDPVHSSLESSGARYQLSTDGRFLLIVDGGGLRAWDLERQQGFHVLTGVNPAFTYIAARTQAIFVQTVSASGGLARPGGIVRVDFPWTSPPVKIGGTEEQVLGGVSPDGQRLIVLRRDTRASVLINTDGTGTPVPVETSAMFSPDGRWVLFTQGTELWVRSEPAGAHAPRLIGQGRAFSAFWSPDGRELFYQDGTDRWTSVTVRGERTDGSITLGPLTPLNVPDDLDLLALAPGGARFLATRRLSSPPATLAIVDNFFEELRAKMAVK